MPAFSIDYALTAFALSDFALKIVSKLIQFACTASTIFRLALSDSGRFDKMASVSIHGVAKFASKTSNVRVLVESSPKALTIFANDELDLEGDGFVNPTELDRKREELLKLDEKQLGKSKETT